MWKFSQNKQENTCAGVFFDKLKKRQSPRQVYFSEFCETYRNSHFVENLWTDAFDSQAVESLVLNIKVDESQTEILRKLAKLSEYDSNTAWKVSK